jgi:hypothetical protein
VKELKQEKEELFRLSRQDLEWFKENYENLKEKYDNQWVIIKEKKIVGNGSAYSDVESILRKKDKKPVIIEFIDSNQLAMFF